MRVGVGGGRLNADKRLAWAVFDRLAKDWPPDTVIIEGDAPGYDRIAGAWARRRKLTNIKVRIDPEKDGWRDDAPKRRNQRLLDEEHPDLFIAFSGGPGTRDMIDRCLRSGVDVYDVDATSEGFFTVWLVRSGEPGRVVVQGRVRD